MSNEYTAEEIRLVYRHLYWATKHLANIYNAIKPEEKPIINFDPNQLSLFATIGEKEVEDEQ